MQTTVFDPHWDPRLRQLIHRYLLGSQADSVITTLFEEAKCTTLEAAKALLTEERPFLESFPDARRTAFLQQLEAADVTGTVVACLLIIPQAFFAAILHCAHLVTAFAYAVLSCPCRYLCRMLDAICIQDRWSQ
jgi:hypothetical protein